jgi:hypothetical protein
MFRNFTGKGLVTIKLGRTFPAGTILGEPKFTFCNFLRHMFFFDNTVFSKTLQVSDPLSDGQFHMPKTHTQSYNKTYASLMWNFNLTKCSIFFIW